MGLVYDFSGRDIEEKKAVLARLKVMLYVIRIGLGWK
jgi:hypothetical protein